MVVYHQIIIVIVFANQGIREWIQLSMMRVLVNIAVDWWEVLVWRLVNNVARSVQPLVLLAAAFLLLQIEFTCYWLLFGLVEHHFSFVAARRGRILHVDSAILFCLLEFNHAIVLVYRWNTLIV